MSSGERPIGAAKGKRSDIEALCQPPPPPDGLKQHRFSWGPLELGHSSIKAQDAGAPGG